MHYHAKFNRPMSSGMSTHRGYKVRPLVKSTRGQGDAENIVDLFQSHTPWTTIFF